MVTAYVCKQCGTAITIGFEHFESEDPAHIGQCEGVCRGCGGQYVQDVFVRGTGGEYLYTHEITFRNIPPEKERMSLAILQNQFALPPAEAAARLENLPFSVLKEVNKQVADSMQDQFKRMGVVAEVRVIARKKNPDFHPARQDRLFWKNPATNAYEQIAPAALIFNADNSINLDAFSCVQCHQTGMLMLNDDVALDICPVCKAASLSVELQWDT